MKDFVRPDQGTTTPSPYLLDYDEPTVSHPFREAQMSGHATPLSARRAIECEAASPKIGKEA